MQTSLPADLIDPDAAKVLRRLTGHGYDAYLVGGCVRDLLLKRQPKDFDIATSARPRQIRRLFRNSRVIGRRFRLVHIHFGSHVLEVATFRAPPLSDDDSELYVTRDNVYGTEVQDAFRRDFTINGLFYDLAKANVIDHVDGLADLDAGVLRMIGEANVRLREDPVRILRAAKFAGRLKFELSPALRDAATAHCEDLRKAAPPRLLEEFYRLVSGEGAARSFRLLDELGALNVMLPELYPLDESFFESLERTETVTRGGRNNVPQSLLLSVLLWPQVRRVLAEQPTGDPETHVYHALQGFAARFTLSRRDLSRACQGLAGQLRLAGDPESRIGKRFARREIFPEVLQLREILGPIDPDSDADDGEALKVWRELAGERDTPSERTGPRRRRRRRRRRPSRGDGA